MVRTSTRVRRASTRKYSLESTSSSVEEFTAPIRKRPRNNNISMYELLNRDETTILSVLMNGGHRLTSDVDNDSKCDEYVTILTEPKGFVGNLKDYQMEGLTWLANLYVRGLNGILADEMGLGKTIQTIALFTYLREYHNVKGPHLILAPKSTLGNWFSECNKFAPAMKCVMFIGSKAEREEIIPNLYEYDVIITSYEMALQEKCLLKKFKLQYLVIDEAHRIKNDESQLSITSRTFEANFRLLLTGTPLQNNTRELWSLLNFLFPAVFHSVDEFESIFSVSSENDATSQKEIVQGIHRLLRPFMLRREKDEVLINLPPKKESLIYIPLSDLQKKLYKDLLGRNSEGDSLDQRSRLMNLCMELRKCCNHPYLIEGIEDKTRDPFGEHLVNNSGKLFFLDRLLQRIIPNGDKVLIFSQMVRLLDILDDYCRMRTFSYCRIDGSTQNRDEQIARFKDPSVSIFLLSTRAGGLGINLTQANVVVLYDMDWNPQQDLQAVDRAHRIGQSKTVMVYRFIHEYTIEQNMLERASLKLQLDQTLINKGQFGFRKATDRLGQQDLKGMVVKGLSKISLTDSSLENLKPEDIENILKMGEKRSEDLKLKWQSSIKSSAYDFSQLNYVNKGHKSLVNMFEDNVEVEDDADMDIWNSSINTQVEVSNKRRRTVSTGVVDLIKKYMQISKISIQPWHFVDTNEINKIDAELMPMIEEVKYMSQIGKHTETIMRDMVTRKEELINSGFTNWQRTDYYAFLRHLQKFGDDHKDMLVNYLNSAITYEEVVRYFDIFQKKYVNLPDHRSIQGKLNKAKTDKKRKDHLMSLLKWKLDSGLNTVSSNKNIRPLKEEDKWFIYYLYIFDCNDDWELYRQHLASSNEMKNDWSVQTYSKAHIARKFDSIKRNIQKEMDAQNKKKEELNCKKE